MLHVQVQLVYFYVIADLQKRDIFKKKKRDISLNLRFIGIQ